MKRAEIQAEIAALRAKADAQAGSAVATLLEKRKFCARVMRVNATKLDTTRDGDLLNYEEHNGKVRIRLMDKGAAIRLDNDLAGDGSEAESNDALSDLIKRIMMESPRGGARNHENPEKPENPEKGKE